MNQKLQISERIFGLDFLRATAICMVVFSHLYYLTDSYGSLIISFSGIFGYAGVELFFVLSGFLIGTIILKNYLNESFDFQTIASFLRRRWMRTLPNYYVVLLLNILLGCFFNFQMNHSWKFFFFLQNFAQYNVTFFSESWSLCVEEFTYLLAPFVFCLSHYFSKNKKRNFIITSLSLIIFFHLVRFWFHKTHFIGNMEQWDLQVKSIVIYRIDSIFFGFVVAWVHFFYPQKLKNISVYFIILALHLFFLQFVALNVLGFAINTKPIYFVVFYFSLSSATFALVLPFFANWKHAKGFFANSITWVSKLSYAIYLLHYSVILNVVKFLKTNYCNNTSITSLIIIYLLLVALLSYILYFFVEKPIMKKR